MVFIVLCCRWMPASRCISPAKTFSVKVALLSLRCDLTLATPSLSLSVPPSSPSHHGLAMSGLGFSPLPGAPQVASAAMMAHNMEPASPFAFLAAQSPLIKNLGHFGSMYGGVTASPAGFSLYVRRVWVWVWVWVHVLQVAVLLTLLLRVCVSVAAAPRLRPQAWRCEFLLGLFVCFYVASGSRVSLPVSLPQPVSVPPPIPRDGPHSPPRVAVVHSDATRHATKPRQVCVLSSSLLFPSLV